jgi:hypothetical protein
VKRKSRSVVIWGGGLVALSWLVVHVLPGLLHGIETARWNLIDRVALLERSRAELAQGVQLQDSANALQARLIAEAPRLIAGGADAEASDAMAGLLSLAVSRGNGKLSRSEPVADSATRGLLHGVTLLVGFDTDAAGLLSVLRNLAEGRTTLTIESLTVMVADPSALPSSAELLRVEVVVRGWYLRKVEA